MNKTEVMNKLSRSFHKVGFKLKKHSPEILVMTGVTGAVVSAVMACKATTKINDILEDAKEQLNTINEYAEHPESLPEPCTQEDAKKDRIIVCTKTGVELAKVYGPAIAVGTLSIAAIFAGNNILRKRNLALAAAYISLDKSFKGYRSRVIERFGEELDRELKYNIKAKTVEEVVVNEDGTETVVKKDVNVVDGDKLTDYSPFARFFDEACAGWDDDAEYNLLFLRKQEQWANDVLKARGYLFLNEVYRSLGIPETKQGQIAGWIYDEKCPNGDNYVSFGLTDIYKTKTRDFVNGYEKVILLDFNVDGDILDLM